MHLVGDDQRRHRKDRTKAERFFKRVNTVRIAIQFTCFFVALTQLSIASGRTFVGASVFFPGRFELERALNNKTGDCTFNTQGDYFSASGVPLTVNERNRGFFFARLSATLRTALATNAVAVLIGGVNKVLMEFNIFEFQYHQLVFHKEVISLLEVLFLIYNVIALAETEMWGRILRGFLKHCDVEGDTAIPFTTPLIELYVSAVLALSVNFVSLAIHVLNASKKGGVTVEGVRAGERGAIDADPRIQYDEYGYPVLDGDGLPIHDATTIPEIVIVQQASQAARAAAGGGQR